jgi:hypothetical protein
VRTMSKGNVGPRIANNPTSAVAPATPAPPVTERLHYYATELEGVTSRLYEQAARLGGKFEASAVLADSDGALDAAANRYQCSLSVLSQVVLKLESL